jgi:hypothetical protein
LESPTGSNTGKTSGVHPQLDDLQISFFLEAAHAEAIAKRPLVTQAIESWLAQQIPIT